MEAPQQVEEDDAGNYDDTDDPVVITDVAQFLALQPAV